MIIKYDRLPETLQRQILYLLQAGNFVEAKERRDAYVSFVSAQSSGRSLSSIDKKF